ncbi:Fatty-acyl CoA reductase 5 [Operophtera brumata]|uniref:Fatty acyl-CoA reductase n=1 Tax=Operophtera brumata TaxID=104452 RepID=A0A0L7L6Y8_OPEBR|nr:Fatty-acyl CoA reductase 5 [Operophtera brumata]
MGFLGKILVEKLLRCCEVENLYLLVFMHISTAYSNSHLSRIEERFYECSVNLEPLQRSIDKLSDGEIDSLLPQILGAWPNTYTFTKALAEKELRISAGSVPIGIFRPAIVTSTAKEPLTCWLDNMPPGECCQRAQRTQTECDELVTADIVPVDLVVSGLLASAASVHNAHKQRTLQCDELVTADIVPVDLVVSGLLASAASVHNAHKQSSVENRITWGDFLAKNMARIDNHPFSDAVWYFSLTLTKSAILNSIYMVMLHLIPAAIMDGLALCLGRTPKYVTQPLVTKSAILNSIYMVMLHLIPAAIMDGLALCLGRTPNIYMVMLHLIPAAIMDGLALCLGRTPNIYMVMLHLIPAAIMDGLALCLGRTPKYVTQPLVTKSAILNSIYMVMLHLIPAAIMDGLALCLGRTPKKIHKFSSVLSYFCTTEIEFCNRRTRELWDSTTEADKKKISDLCFFCPLGKQFLMSVLSKLFPFSMQSVDWDEYFDSYLAGIRRSFKSRIQYSQKMPVHLNLEYSILKNASSFKSIKQYSKKNSSFKSRIQYSQKITVHLNLKYSILKKCQFI